jgi:predicted dehydrogenase
MDSNLLKIGVIGVGHLGQHHVKHFCSIGGINFLGLFDTNTNQANAISKKFKVKAFENIDNLIDSVDAVSIVTPTTYHASVAEKCIRKKKHVFIEKPITSTIEEADKLLALAKKNKVIVQVGHIERLNPALRALEPYKINPKFIEIQRLAPYNTRGTDVPVVLDKMIHDIDIVLSLVDSKVRSISASGLSILTDSIDIAHAQIKFENGCVSSITSSRIAKDEVRKIKTFQQNLYSTVDLYKGLTEVYTVSKKGLDKKSFLMSVPFNYKNKTRHIIYEKPTIIKEDALKLELINFTNSMKGLEMPIVSGQSGREALNVAIEIQEKIIKGFIS